MLELIGLDMAGMSDSLPRGKLNIHFFPLFQSFKGTNKEDIMARQSEHWPGSQGVRIFDMGALCKHGHATFSF